jgi:hypothetical protein
MYLITSKRRQRISHQLYAMPHRQQFSDLAAVENQYFHC